MRILLHLADLYDGPQRADQHGSHAIFASDHGAAVLDRNVIGVVFPAGSHFLEHFFCLDKPVDQLAACVEAAGALQEVDDGKGWCFARVVEVSGHGGHHYHYSRIKARMGDGSA